MTIESARFRTTTPLPPGNYQVVVEAVGASANYGVDRKTISITVPTPVPPTAPPAATRALRRDPLAQTIETHDSDLFVAAVELYFSAKPAGADASDNNVRVRIVEVDNGFPTAKVLTFAETSLKASQVVTDDYTSFTFPGPVYLKRNTRYAIVVITKSAEYLVWTARVGGTLVGTNTVMGGQAYAAGVLQQSADEVTWGPVYDTDLTFRLKCINYSPEKTIEFQPVACADSTGFRLEPTFLLPDDKTNNEETACAIKWYYKLDSVNIWYPFEPYSDIFPGVIFDQLTFKVFMQSLGDNAVRVTPVISMNNPAKILTTYKRGFETELPSKTLTLPTAYRYVRMIATMTQASACKWFVSDNTAAVTPTVYSSGANYSVGALVTSGGKTWLALTVSGPASTVVTPVQGANWTEASTLLGVVWRLMPETGQVVTSLGNGKHEYERTLDLGTNSGRTQFRYMIKQQVATVDETAVPPTITNIMCILNS